MTWFAERGRRRLLLFLLPLLLLTGAGSAYLLAPHAIGALIEQSKLRLLGEAPLPCLNLAEREQYVCWNRSIDDVLTNEGIEESFRALERFSKGFPNFIQVCHSHAHRIGERAYKEFREGATLSVSPAMQLCDFGFYHGFITEFLAQSRDPEEVGEFCMRMESSDDEGKQSYSRDACFHGVGHGSIERHDPEDWGDPDAVLQQTLTLCRAATATAFDYEKCAGGAYNGMSYGTYGKEILDKSDPFAICRGLSAESAPKECYGNLAAVVFNLTEHKYLQEAIDLARSYETYPHIERAIATFAAMSARQPGSQEMSMRACDSLPPTLSYHCLWGYVSGLIQAEVPDSRQERAYALCAGQLIADGERNTCFTAAFYQLSDFWSKEKIANSCELTPGTGRGACEETLAEWLSRS